jgi:hypothetical protein
MGHAAQDPQVTKTPRGGGNRPDRVRFPRQRGALPTSGKDADRDEDKRDGDDEAVPSLMASRLNAKWNSKTAHPVDLKAAALRHGDNHGDIAGHRLTRRA